MLHTAEICFRNLEPLTPRCVAHRGDNFAIEYFDEIETKFENNLVCISGAQMGSNHEKTRGRKSRETLPLMLELQLRPLIQNTQCQHNYS